MTFIWDQKEFKGIFFLGRVSLWTTADPVFKSLCLHPSPICRSSHTTDRIAGAHRSTFKLSAALPSRKANLFPRRENQLFCHSVCEMAPLYPPSDADFVFSDIRGRHSVPVIWAGFHRRVFLPSTFCHSVCEMVPHYSPKRDNNNRFGEFSFSLRPVYGRFFYPGFPSCGRAGPGVESRTFGLEIRCSTTEPFQPPFFGQHMLPCVFTGLDMI